MALVAVDSKRPWLWVGNLPDEAFLQDLQLLFWFVEGVEEVWPIRVGKIGCQPARYYTTQGVWALMRSMEDAVRVRAHLDSRPWFGTRLVTQVGMLPDSPYPYYFPDPDDLARVHCPGGKPQLTGRLRAPMQCAPREKGDIYERFTWLPYPRDNLPPNCVKGLRAEAVAFVRERAKRARSESLVQGQQGRRVYGVWVGHFTAADEGKVRELFQKTYGLVEVRVQAAKPREGEQPKSYAYGNYGSREDAVAAQKFVCTRLPKREGLHCPFGVKERLLG